MNFVNNWTRPITLAAGETALALDLPDGTYRLTIADSATAATAWEIVQAEVVGGAATLTRGQEGTEQQSWPAGSVIFCSVTAEFLYNLPQVEVGEGWPTEPPAAAGRYWVAAGEFWIALGGAALDDWHQIAGWAPNAGVALTNNDVVDVPLGLLDRLITVSAGIPDAPRARLVMPGYSRAARGVVVACRGVVGKVLELTLDFGAVSDSENFGAAFLGDHDGVSASILDGSSVVLAISADVQFTLNIDPWADETVRGASCEILVAPLQVTTDIL